MGRKKNWGIRLTNNFKKKNSNEISIFFANQDKIKSTSIYFEQVVPFIANTYENTNMEVIKDIIINDLKVPFEVRD